MLNDFVELFLGAYHEFIPETYVHRLFFDSVICTVLFAVLITGILFAICLVFKTLFQALLKGVNKD